ncbi:MAG: sensor histidine kinase, partial [Gemmatimonadales bacterium]
MTLTAEGPTRRRGLSLRALVVLLVLAGGLYAAAVALYFTISTGAAANALGQGTTAVVALQDDLGKRHGALIRARRLTWQLLRRSTPPRVAELDRVRALAAAGAVRARAEPYASVPPELRVVLARVDESLSRLGNTLTEACAALVLGRRSQAVRTMERADSLQNQVDDGLERAMQLARADLLVRQAALRQVTRHAVRDGGLMLAAVVLFVPLALLVVRRRLWQPLVGLEEGLRRVGEGDLTTQVPVRRQDELGRVSALFNDTTLILRNRAEEQGRFAAAGELLAGVAHEVNNPLMAIASHAELRLGDPDLSAEQRAEMQSILRQAQRAAKLLRGLLRFVRAGEPRAARVNLNDAVRGAIDLVAYRFPVDEISIEGQLDHTLPPVEGDANRLEQVLVNLLSNALDALRNVPPPRRLIVDSYVEDGRVCVAVTDNGPGVAPEIAQRLFRPFATTKGRRGTGLGLYISRQLVREAGGDLALVRAPGRGARFLVTLPPAGTVVPDSTP